MKIFFSLMLFSINVLAVDLPPTDVLPTLKCSANGMTLLHVPGAFTSQSEQYEAARILNDNIMLLNPNKFDLKSQAAQLIPIASQGLIQDKMNYLMMSYGDQVGPDAEKAAWMTFGMSEYGLALFGDLETVTSTGVNISKYVAKKSVGVMGHLKAIKTSKAKEIYNAIYNFTSQGISVVGSDGKTTLLQELTSENAKDNLTRAGKYLGMTDALLLNPFGIKNVLNYASVWALEGNYLAAVDQHRGTLLASYWTNQENINTVANSITDKLDASQKVILSAHGEGNQLAERAIAQIQSTGTSVQQDRLWKYVSVLATSPTSGAYTSRYSYMKNDNDNRIFGGSNIIYNYVLEHEYTNSSLWQSIKTAFVVNSGSASSFLDYYIGEVQQGKTKDGTSYQSMRDNFIGELRASAEKLESSCLPPAISHVTAARDVEFTLTDGYIIEGTKRSYLWDFGDGETLTTTDKVVSHSYPDLLERDITVKLLDENSNILYEISDYLYDRTWTQLNLFQVNRNVKIWLDSEIHYENVILTYEWDFGDGQKGTSFDWSIVHSYFNEGTYVINVRVFDENGQFLFAEKRFVLVDQSSMSFGGIPITGPNAYTVADYMNFLSPELYPTTKIGFNYEVHLGWEGTCYAKGLDYFYLDQSTGTYGIGDKYVYMPLYNCTYNDDYFTRNP